MKPGPRWPLRLHTCSAGSPVLLQGVWEMLYESDMYLHPCRHGQTLTAFTVKNDRHKQRKYKRKSEGAATPPALRRVASPRDGATGG